MKFFMATMISALLLSTTTFAAVEVTCVCSKYDLSDSDQELVLKVEELYKTTQWARVEACEAGTAVEINKRAHFNCKGVAKEDLASDRL